MKTAYLCYTDEIKNLIAAKDDEMKRKEEANRLIAQAVQKQQAQDEARKRKAATALSASPPPPPPQKIIALQPVVVPMATSAPQNTMPVAVQGELITGIPIIFFILHLFSMSCWPRGCRIEGSTGGG